MWPGGSLAQQSGISWAHFIHSVNYTVDLAGTTVYVPNFVAQFFGKLMTCRSTCVSLSPFHLVEGGEDVSKISSMLNLTKYCELFINFPLQLNYL